VYQWQLPDSAHNISFADLFENATLKALDRMFRCRLRAANRDCYRQLVAYRCGRSIGAPQLSELYLRGAPIVEDLISEVFDIRAELDGAGRRILAHAPVFIFKRDFVQRRARRHGPPAANDHDLTYLDEWLTDVVGEVGDTAGDRELAVARYAASLNENDITDRVTIEKLKIWCAHCLFTPEGRELVRSWVSFEEPRSISYSELVHMVGIPGDLAGRAGTPDEALRTRDGFTLTATRAASRVVQNQIELCLFCHGHDGDFCSKGFPVTKGQWAQGFKRNALGVALTGCPLEEKISEVHALKRQGYTIAPLVAIMADNPMCPVTGYRICNDCMKSCVYQKQEPVNIPQIETACLDDVLALPWGVEIYDLLTRWNPLRARQWVPSNYTGKKVLIAGMGPAGFSLAHHLLMEGIAVVGIDGLKIEPLPSALLAGPIRNFADIAESLDSRTMSGFGGVAEYGITVRWDKNYLKLIQLSLMRRRYFQVFGGVRFGGTLQIEDAWMLGFDHLSIAVGAGLPTPLRIPGSLVPGMRQASDFLMTLQLSGAARATSLANLQVRLPAVVIGGGLTAIDAATELQAYYLAQIERVRTRYERLCTEQGESAVRQRFLAAELSILDEFRAHANEVCYERARAEQAGERPRLEELVRRWGGVTVVYRRAISDSPGYVRNHEEVNKALEEGILYAQHLDPKEVETDDDGSAAALICERTNDIVITDDSVRVTLPARTILVATGARPNIAYGIEYPDSIMIDGKYYRPHRMIGDALEATGIAEHCKAEEFGPFTSIQDGVRRVSFVGDAHPAFHGSVVKAVASGKRTAPLISQALNRDGRQRGNERDYSEFRNRMDNLLTARVLDVVRRGRRAVEVRVRAPLAAWRFRPGQIFRLQNFEACAPQVGQTRLQTEAMAMTGTQSDQPEGTLSLLVIERGSSSRLCATFRSGDPIVLMGPTGAPFNIPATPQTMMIIGRERGAAQVRALGPALHKAGHCVLFVACFEKAEDIFCQGELEAAADAILWVVRTGPPIVARRPQDRSDIGEPVSALLRYGDGLLDKSGSKPSVELHDVTRVVVSGDPGLIRKIKAARDGRFGQLLSSVKCYSAAITAPMQCMLKGVCSQCIQWQVDPKSGARVDSFFCCAEQEKGLDLIDIDSMEGRLRQNLALEKLSSLVAK